MQIGISLTSFFPVDDPREGVRRMIARTRAAKAAGLDSLFVGDHHAMPQPYYQNTPILGRLLGEWGDRPAGALFLLPLWHPVLLAEQVGTLAAIAEGPFVLQCALGAGRQQFEAMGVKMEHRPSRFEQGLELVRRLLAGEAVSSEGRWHLSGARVSPTPATAVEVWIGASAEPAIDRAARLGDGWIAAPGLPPDLAKEQLELYRRCCQRHGRGLGRAVIRRDVYVGESDEEAAQSAGPIVEAGYRGFPPGATIVGGIDKVASFFGTLRTMGYSDVIVRNLMPDPEKALASTERLGEVKRLLNEGSPS